MHEIWTRLEDWLAAHAPLLLPDLNPGATEAELSRLAATIGAELPADFLAFYRVHDGQRGDAGGLYEAEELLSVGRMLDEWTVWNDLLRQRTFDGAYSAAPAGVKDNWWNPRWLPLTYDGSGNHCCLDLDPAPGGTYGQVIRMWHDDDERPLLAPSFRAWIMRYVVGLEAGRYAYLADYDGLVPVDDL